MNSAFPDRDPAVTAAILNAILTHSRDCIKLLTLNGEIEYASVSAASALGLSEPRDAVGKDWRRFWPDDLKPAFDAAIAAAVSGASTRFDGPVPGSDGKARHWDVTISPVHGADRTIDHLLAVSTDVTARKVADALGRERWEVAQDKAGQSDVVAREMQHRFKNQLAVIGAIARLLARHTESARELADKLEERLLALARAQDLLSEHSDKPVAAREAVARVLAASGMGDRVELGKCPDAPLGEAAIRNLALLLGELQTNALKHGALRHGDGAIALAGTLANDVVTLRWHERCVESVIPPQRDNGGFQLIRRIGGAGSQKPTIVWDDHGIIVEFHLNPIK